jgi:hypothetical protein
MFDCAPHGQHNAGVESKRILGTKREIETRGSKRSIEGKFRTKYARSLKPGLELHSQWTGGNRMNPEQRYIPGLKLRSCEGERTPCNTIHPRFQEEKLVERRNLKSTSGKVT